MTLFLAILMPISVRWLARKWHLGIHFHNFIMLVYMIDIVRRHTHPHSWIFNLPVFVLYALDKVWGTWWMGRCEPDIVSRTHLSHDYLVVTWAHPTGSSRNPRILYVVWVCPRKKIVVSIVHVRKFAMNVRRMSESVFLLQLVQPLVRDPIVSDCRSSVSKYMCLS